jgi:xylulokinase
MPIIGIDVGTQSLKATVVDDDMRPRGEGAVSYRPSFPRSGWAEQDSALWLNALAPAIGRALSAAGLQQDDFAAIAVTGQLDGCLPADGEGRALAPCIIWMDRRATEEAARVPAELLRDRAGLVRDASHMAAKIAWAERHLPEAARAATWHQPVSFIVAALCGRAVMDHALASTTMLYALGERDYAGDLLAAFGVERNKLPDIDHADALAGKLSREGAELTGLRPGTLVAVGTGDDFANAIGAGVTDPEVVGCNLGTGEAIGAVSRKLLIDREGLVETHGYLGDRFYVSNPGWLSGGAVAWFLSAFDVDTAERMSALAQEAQPGAGGVIFLPALSGAMAPRWDAGARGAFYGLAPMHGRADCARAVLEGCAFAMRDVVERLDAMGLPTRTIRLTGGGAQSRVWAQIRADVAQLPVEYGRADNAAPLGAAALAAVTAGLAEDVTSAAGVLLRDCATLEPDTSRKAAYDEAHARYRRLFEALTPMFEPTP